MLHTKFAHKVSHVANTRTPESVNALVIVTHRQHRAAVLGRQACNHFDPSVLQLVGVLKLIDQHMLETCTVVQSDGVVVAQ